jgi:hypothetical protein
VEVFQFSNAIYRAGVWPWRANGEPGPLLLLVSVIIRVGLGFVLAAVFVSTGQVSGPIGVLIVGTAAPLLIEQLTKLVPLETYHPRITNTDYREVSKLRVEPRGEDRND